MSDYTPNTDHLRMVYAGINENRRAEFDRWLASHDRQVKAEAWNDGANAAIEAGDYYESGPDGVWINPRNPYRDASSHGRSVATQPEPQA